MAAPIFYSSLVLLIYCYLLYPAVLCCLPRRNRWSLLGREADKFEALCWPSLSVVLAAYNEAKVITAKIENFLACSYPGSSEIVIVSDGSTDRTVWEARQFASPRVRVITEPTRRGKGAAINRAVQEARGEILVFTDANAFFTRETLTELVCPFADERVGLVTGCTRYPDGTIGSIYQRYEQMLKRLEALGGVIATADGAAYALRRSLWREHDPVIINDFFHPILVSLHRADSLISPKAMCVEEFSVENEFARQVRMVSQASFVYLKFLPELINAKRWRSIFVLTSHKLLRWLTVPLLALLVAATFWLGQRRAIYAIALCGEGLFAALVMIGSTRAAGARAKLSFAYQFMAFNLAGTLGLWRCLIGTVPVVWRPRSQ